MVVSNAPIKREKVADAYEVTGHFPQMHGAPIHSGTPESIGIGDITRRNTAILSRLKGRSPAFLALRGADAQM